MEKWILENKDWVVPLSVALLSLVGAALGGWWAGRKRIGIEVLSKNRQEWINDLRRQVSEFISLAMDLSDEIVNKKLTTKYEISEQREIIKKIYKIIFIRDYLILLLNPDENDSQNIIINIENTIATINKLHNTNMQNYSMEIATKYALKIEGHITKLTKSTQLVLKTEWKRVKKGI